MKLVGVALIAVLLAAPKTAVMAVGASCEALSSMVVRNMKIDLAEAIPAGDFSLPASAPSGQDQKESQLPAFCRIAATLKPSSDSDIKVEVWMPTATWNGEFQAVGNGGWGGSISYAAMANALRRGYATSSTDTGHSGPGGSFALGHPDKLIDFAYRSVHEMTAKAKAVIAAFYGNGPRLSYWNGCSSGGRQALLEAQRFPDDFDGIIAGAPANDWTGRSAQSMWVAQALHADDASYIPPTKYPLIHDAVLAACDAIDGVADGVLEDPTVCKFDPGVLACKGSDAATCLTAPQVEAARRIYAPATNPRTKQKIFPGLEPGSELGWANLGGPGPYGTGEEYFKYVVFKNPNWDYKTLNFDGDVVLAHQLDHGTINATNPNLKPFFARRGKLIQYHGWADQQISPGSSVRYYQSVLDTMKGTTVSDSYRLFMVPGMGHCRGGNGTDTFDMVAALEQWVEHGKAPDRIIASRVTNGTTDRTRPLCPYPQVANYQGSGGTDVAANFVCATR